MAKVQMQPMSSVWNFENEWDTGLCGCCDNKGTCCFAFFCYPCFACKLQSRTGECACTWCLPGGNTALRTKVRTGFRIRGAVCGDACTTSFCPCCSMIQIQHELEFRGL